METFQKFRKESALLIVCGIVAIICIFINCLSLFAFTNNETFWIVTNFLNILSCSQIFIYIFTLRAIVKSEKHKFSIFIICVLSVLAFCFSTAYLVCMTAAIYFVAHHQFFMDWGCWLLGITCFGLFFDILFIFALQYQTIGRKIPIKKSLSDKEIKVNKGKVIIEFDEKKIAYQDWEIPVNVITEIELIHANRSIAKMIPSDYEAKNRLTFKENCTTEKFKLAIRTTDPMHIVEFISAKYEDCITISETIVYMLKNKK
jgi:hypothetical protein